MTTTLNATRDRLLNAAELSMEEERNTQAIVTAALNARPRNTSLALIPRQREFISWATNKHYDNPETVTEAKVALFITSEVIGRDNRKNRSKKVGKATVDQYITALTSLWKLQVERKVNSNPSPRGLSVRSIQQNLERTVHDDRKSSFFDRGRLYQHLLTSEMKVSRRRVAEHFWSDSSSFAGLRNRLGYLMTEQGLIRGENVRDLEFPDFFTVDMDDEGPSSCTAMVIIKGRGKTNQYGKPLFSGFYRHADVRLCTVSAVAFFLFYRFHIAGEKFPDFSESAHWYNTVLFSSSVKHPRKSISPSAHARAIDKAHKTLSILSPKLTHGGRLYGRQHLEQSGVDKVSADVAGGWSTGAGEGCYGNGLSRPSMRAMAGFPPDEKLYYIPRGNCKPPVELLKQIFPSLDEWQRRHQEHDRCVPNFALHGFLRFLNFMREVLLQDAAVTMDTYPHEIFKHVIFKSAEFTSYKNNVQLILRTQEHNQNCPITEEIKRVMPELCRQLSVNHDDLRCSVINAIKSSTSEIRSAIDHNQSVAKGSVDAIRGTLISSLSRTVRLLQNESSNQNDQSTARVEQEDTTMMNTESDLTLAASEMPRFEDIISSAINSVPNVLLEWEHGLNSKPSVVSIEARWKNKWRLSTKHQKIYSRRVQMIKLIQRLAQRRGITTNEAASIIEGKRELLNLSITSLADHSKRFEREHLM